MGSVEAAEEYFFDVAGRILSTRLGQIELEPPLPKNEDDKFCEVWTGFAHLIGGDMLIDASAEALLRLLQPVRLMEELLTGEWLAGLNGRQWLRGCLLCMSSS